ncbi:hypothetical protein OSTOST_14835 [Ostertagia ostertagi]
MSGVEYQKRELRISKVAKKAKIAKIQQARKKSGGAQQPKLNKDQEEKINKFKFSTKKATTGGASSAEKEGKKSYSEKEEWQANEKPYAVRIVLHLSL